MESDKTVMITKYIEKGKVLEKQVFDDDTFSVIELESRKTLINREEMTEVDLKKIEEMSTFIQKSSHEMKLLAERSLKRVASKSSTFETSFDLINK